jgi:ribosomal protein S18 acetylase RimI-like enzyme
MNIYAGLEVSDKVMLVCAVNGDGRFCGAALLEALIAHAAGVVEQVRLGVIDTNIAAIRLYERHGFEVYGREVRALKTAAGYADEVLMVRFLR